MEAEGLAAPQAEQELAGKGSSADKIEEHEQPGKSAAVGPPAGTESQKPTANKDRQATAGGKKPANDQDGSAVKPQWSEEADKFVRKDTGLETTAGHHAAIKSTRDSTASSKVGHESADAAKRDHPGSHKEQNPTDVANSASEAEHGSTDATTSNSATRQKEQEHTDTAAASTGAGQEVDDGSRSQSTSERQNESGHGSAEGGKAAAGETEQAHAETPLVVSSSADSSFTFSKQPGQGDAADTEDQREGSKDISSLQKLRLGEHLGETSTPDYERLHRSAQQADATHLVATHSSSISRSTSAHSHAFGTDGSAPSAAAIAPEHGSKANEKSSHHPQEGREEDEQAHSKHAGKAARSSKGPSSGNEPRAHESDEADKAAKSIAAELVGKAGQNSAPDTQKASVEGRHAASNQAEDLDSNSQSVSRGRNGGESHGLDEGGWITKSSAQRHQRSEAASQGAQEFESHIHEAPRKGPSGSGNGFSESKQVDMVSMPPAGDFVVDGRRRCIDWENTSTA